MATPRKDYKLDSDGDLLFKNGDWVIAESDQQHIEDTINADVGWWKEFPTDGVAVRNYSNSSNDIAKLSRKIKIELEKDGYKVDNPIISIDANGQLTINPNATRV